MMPTHDTRFYRIRLGAAAATRGDRVLCQWLGWAGTQDGLARVRIVHSTLPSYHVGRVELIERRRLIPVRPPQ